MKVEVDVNLGDPVMLAKAFCDMNDEDQAQFFEEVSKCAQAWHKGSCMQWFMVGRHMRDCDCITWEGQNVVTEIYQAMQDK